MYVNIIIYHHKLLRDKIKPKCKFICIYRYTIFIQNKYSKNSKIVKAGSKIVSLLKRSKKKRLVYTITINRNMYVYLFN